MVDDVYIYYIYILWGSNMAMEHPALKKNIVLMNCLFRIRDFPLPGLSDYSYTRRIGN